MTKDARRDETRRRVERRDEISSSNYEPTPVQRGYKASLMCVYSKGLITFSVAIVASN
jgi:hypothetical protein